MTKTSTIRAVMLVWAAVCILSLVACGQTGSGSVTAGDDPIEGGSTTPSGSVPGERSTPGPETPPPIPPPTEVVNRGSQDGGLGSLCWFTRQIGIDATNVSVAETKALMGQPGAEGGASALPALVSTVEEADRSLPAIEGKLPPETIPFYRQLQASVAEAAQELPHGGVVQESEVPAVIRSFEKWFAFESYPGFPAFEQVALSNPAACPFG